MFSTIQNYLPFQEPVPTKGPDSPISITGCKRRKTDKNQFQEVRNFFASFKNFTSQPYLLQQPIDFSQLSQLYKYDLLTQSVPETLYFDSIRETLLKIESYFSSCSMNEATLSGIRNYIISLLPNPNKSYVISEIGLIYFYLDKYDFLPCDKDFYIYREKEIENEILCLKETEIQNLPTGFSAYLLRVLCNMILTSKDGVNKGGLIAAKHLLCGRFSKYFKEDHIQHIDTIFTHILKNESFASALNASITLHPSMEFFVRIDLRIPFEQQVTAQDVRFACLYALLFDLRQYLQPNCFAIAPLIYTAENAPLAVLMKYQEFLQSGFLTTDSNCKIPISALICNRLVEDQELDDLLTLNQIKNCSSIQIALKVIGVDIDTLNLQNDSQFLLKDFLHYLSAYSPYGNLSFYIAASVIGSFKKNALQEMLISSLEFLEINQTETTDLPNKPRGVKKKLIAFIHNELVVNLSTVFPDYLAQSENCEFINEFLQQMAASLWLQNSKGKLIEANGEVSVVIGETPIKIPNFAQDLETLQGIAKSHRKLISLRNNQVTVLDTTRALDDFLINLIHEIYEQRLASSRSVPSQMFMMLLNGFFISPFLAEALSTFLAEVNQSVFPLNQADYLNSRILFFYDDGGCTLDFPIKSFGLSYNTKTFSSFNPVLNIIEICKYLNSSANKDQFISSGYPLLCSSDTHSFLLQPFKFATLWQTDPKALLDEYSIKPMRQLLNAPLSQETIKKVLLQSFKQEDLANSFLSNHFSGEFSGLQFLNLFKQVAPKIYQRLFLVALEKALTQIPCASIPWQQCLNKLFGTLDPIVLLQMETQLKATFLQYQTLQPFEIAILFQQVLLHFRKSVSKIKLEILLCKEFQLPITWTLGDLNYSDFVEAPSHVQLILKCLPDCMGLMSRKGNHEYIFAENFTNGMKSLTIVHV